MVIAKTKRSFGKADHGVNWALSQLPSGTHVELLPFKGAKGEDDYAIKFERAGVRVLSNSACGTIYGVLQLAELMSMGKKKNLVKNLRFRTRNYKHELHLWNKGQPRYICAYSDEVFEKLCQRVVAHGFNGLTLYPGGHPFEYILDYKGFPEAASQPEADRSAVRERLNSLLEIAHRYGLTTFMQHYINHFTQPLADAYQIPTTGRLSAIDHPIVEKYCRYCYREIFRQCPDLDGLYFNFESTPSGWQHLMKTAIPECNKLKKKPIFAFRLWGFTDIDGMKKMFSAYKGRKILGHKISDTNDTYYLPCADSRVMEWKKALGKKVEWMFLIGPCHNCGTNLCSQLWGDYEFVQALLADAAKKGADSFSFHTITEFFSPEIDSGSVFSDAEKTLARANRMHLQAVVDLVNGQKRSARAQAEVMAQRWQCSPEAGAAVLNAVHASSQLVLLIYQQFCFSSAAEGYLNRGRYSHIQEPFFYYPPNEFNDQATRLMWRGFIGQAWVQKTIPTQVAPKNLLQYIIDYVDPSKPKAKQNPQKIAAALAENIRRSFEALDQLRQLGAAKIADAIEPFLRENADLGEYVRREILAGLELYSIYFASSREQILSALRNGLAELRRLPSIYPDPKSRSFKGAVRVSLTDTLDATPEIKEAEEALRLFESTEFPMKAFQLYCASRHRYNEIRRFVRPLRWHDAPVQKEAIKYLNESLVQGQAALAALAEHPQLAENVRAWVEFVQDELARAVPPELTISTQPGRSYIQVGHEHAFRAGENFLEDFTGFFKKFDYLRRVDQSFRLWYTPKELVVSFRERGVDTQQRKARWAQFKDEGSCSFNHRFFIDTQNKGKGGDCFIIWPEGSSVTKNKQPHVKARCEFSCDAASHEVTAYVPFSSLGRKPKKGEVWGFNVTCNPAVTRNTANSWAATWDSFNPRRWGKIKFQ